MVKSANFHARVRLNGVRGSQSLGPALFEEEETYLLCHLCDVTIGRARCHLFRLPALPLNILQ